jgi:hypothetical protein
MNKFFALFSIAASVVDEWRKNTPGKNEGRRGRNGRVEEVDDGSRKGPRG